MAIALVRDNPGVTAEGYDAVVAEIGLDKEPPAGLILHTAGFFNGIFREVDVWESREAWDTFNRERLWPAVQRAMGDQAPATPPPDAEIMDVYDLIQ
ncbi:MAG: hypothetical protein M3457_20580 [Chloroflexota bacterium]|nr:hypothetical protein [Chloroflexota bacterium]